MYLKTKNKKNKPKNSWSGLVKIFFLTIIVITASCKKEIKFTSVFDNVNDRIWIGKDFWSIPIEDWKIEGGKLHCTGNVAGSRVNLLTHVLSPGAGDFEVSVTISLKDERNRNGSAGLIIGIHDKEDPDVRAACYFGNGVQAGVSLQGYVFLNDEKIELPEEFDFSEFIISIKGNNNSLTMNVVDKKGNNTKDLSYNADQIQGLIAIANNFDRDNEKDQTATFSFDNLEVSGSKVEAKPENAFGPILWTMHTLSKGTLKLMALLPPLGKEDNQEVGLQLKKNGDWVTAATQTIDPDSRTAVFTLKNWDATSDTQYRIEYIEKDKSGTEIPEFYAGTIRKDPTDHPLKLGGLTCQFSSGFPYTPLVKNLTSIDPDILYFSGDQIYEANGGYPIKREPEDISILSYLGKYYMFGWAFGDLMRDRPTICTPDDHDVFHGNLWGESGEAMLPGSRVGTVGGFIQSVKMVNIVNRTQCGQLPDPFDPTPVKQGMSVWYTDLTYGRISFAIISDRVFKTGPEAVATWDGRNDHLKQPLKDLSVINGPELQMAGPRQIKFLNHWIRDWQGADMKVLLSQTVFANAATHHGSKDGSFDGYLYGDLDSGGWPKSGRDEIIELMRKASAFHINGDQHLPTLIQYGLDEFRDAGYSFCTPPISNIYVRWFLPDEVGYPVLDRPEHQYPNTGKYIDAFGNKNYVYAVGNPGDIINDPDSRYNQSQMRTSGFGIITFDQINRTIDIDAWRFLADVENPNPIRDQFPGWPLRISQFDNLGSTGEYILPRIIINKPDQLIEIHNDKTGELSQIYRIRGNEVQPKLHRPGTFNITIGEGERKKQISGLKTMLKSNSQTVSVELQ